MSVSEIYSSNPLPADTKSIRVLTLSPSQLPDDPLIGTIQVISLSCLIEGQLPVYSALSYVWGEFASPADTLLCNGVEVPISRNCRDALRALRSLYGGLIIWVDAICIDQSNMNERVQQIKLMGEIYTWAEVVYIWLGHGSPDIAWAMDYLSKAERRNFLPMDRIRNNQDRRTTLSKVFSSAALSRQLFSEFGWPELTIQGSPSRCLNEFLTQEWFLRAWTFQEVLLSSHSILVSGSTTLQWDTLVQGMAILRYISPMVPDDFIGTDPVLCYEKLPHPRKATFLSLKWSGPKGRPLSTFHAFDRLVLIWMNIDRPMLRSSSRDSSDMMLKQSAYDRQKLYANFHRRFLRNTRFGWIFIIFICLLFIILTQCIPIIAIVKLGSTIFSGDNSGILEIGIKGPLILLCVIFIPWIFPLYNLGGSMKFRDLIYQEVITADDIKRMALEGVIQTIRQQKAKEHLDKSYALYGILQRMGLQLAEADYAKPHGRVYHELMLDLLHWSPAGIIMLLDAGRSGHIDEKMDNVPSWVPDWSQIPSKPTIGPDYFLSSSYRTMDATPKSEPYFELNGNNRKLLIKGQWQGHVAYCAERFPVVHSSSLASAEAGTMTGISQSLEILARWVHTVQCTTRSWRPLSWRRLTEFRSDPYDHYSSGNTVLSDYIQSNNITSKERLDVIDCFFVMKQSLSVLEMDPELQMMDKIIKACLKIDGSDLTGSISVQALQTIWDELRTGRGILRYFLDLIIDLSVNDRRLFVTSDNSLGCGSKDMREGDRILLVAGVPAPLIVRPASTETEGSSPVEFKVVCSVFVLGWMSGSVFEPSRLEDIMLV